MSKNKLLGIIKDKYLATAGNEVDLAGLGIEKLPPEIGNLTNLRSLKLSKNTLTSLPPEIGLLRNLTFLSIDANLIKELPREIGQLCKLESLYLSSNLLKTIPPEIGQLKSLTSLGIIGNGLENLPPEIGQLDKLDYLHLGGNKLTTLPPEIGSLKNLRTLILISNQIKKLPQNINQLTGLTYLNLENNPLNVPPEIVNLKDKPQNILKYYFSSLKKHLNEVKLLVVGQGSVGKTSLVERILHNTFDQNQAKTEGISIYQWATVSKVQTRTVASLKVDLPLSIKLNIWDFGGQEIMHATHQFFLTKRSLYLLVLDARLTQEENRVEYWLKIIQSFGGESPVLIVGNKTDQHPLDIDRTGLQRKYPNIAGVFETSAATGAGIEPLQAEIVKQACTLPFVRDLLPETWFTVKSRLEELAKHKNFITYDEYLHLCDSNDVTDETDKHTLIGFLHDLGLVVHYQDDPRLEPLGILNPQWVTNGVYKIVNSHELFQNQGTLTLPMLNKILTLPEYPSNKRLFIMDMMKKFELCYDIEPDKSFLIPDLLPKDEPFTGEWDDALAFQYHYNVLPSSIITRFIVRMNAFIHKTVWRSGVVLKSDGNTGLVKADIEDHKIYIWVSGDENKRRDFLSAIRMEFEAIHKTIPKLEVIGKVPIPNAPEATPIDIIFLKQLANQGRESLPVLVGNQIIDLIIKEVLDQIDKEPRNTDRGTIINIHNMYGAVGDNNMVSITQNLFEPIYRAIADSSRDLSEKNDLVGDIKEIENEIVKGERADETFLTRRLRNLKRIAPDIAEVALASILGPGAAVSAIVKQIAKKIKDDNRN